MPRKKLKYKESEIQKNLYTFGDEWMTEDKQEYKGLYHKYTETNETYTRGTWDESLSKLSLKIKSPSHSPCSFCSAFKPSIRLGN